MTEKKSDELEIDLRQVFGIVARKGNLIALAAVLCAAMTLLGTVLFVPARYGSSIMFYVCNTASSDGITSSDITASKNLVDSCIVILKTRSVLEEAARLAGVDRDYEELADMVEAEAVDDTEIFRVTVTGTDPEGAYLIADAVAAVLPRQMMELVAGVSVRVVDGPVQPASPCGPDLMKNTVVGFLLGTALCTLAVLVQDGKKRER